jgi:AcrR family transcriptional regulator
MIVMPAKATPAPPADRRTELVAAAYHEIAQVGFEGLRTREVAAAAGVNVATLHYYFPSKETLIRGVLAFAMERFRSTLRSSGSAADQLRSHFAGIRRLVRDEPELFTVMGELAMRSSRDPFIRDLHKQNTDHWRATLRTLLARAAADGSLSGPRNPDAQASLAVAALMGACMLPPIQAARLRDIVLELERALGLE